jgi:D-glycerate 3-kinase
MTEASELLSLVPADIPANESSAEAACLIARRIAGLPRDASPRLIGINGAQGSGKSTLTELICIALERFHRLKPAQFSLDDFYLTKADRERLAREVHPMCATRGVPGTHDIPLMTQVIADLGDAGPDDSTAIPFFDKLADDRVPLAQWPRFAGRPDVILLEGWCVGIDAQDVPPWTEPINELEAELDPNGAWLAWSLNALAEDYPAIWDRFALLTSIEVPGIDTVIQSRLRQEERLAEGNDRPRMDRAGVIRFVQHYERYTRAIWAAMPTRADILYRRNDHYGFELVKS